MMELSPPKSLLRTLSMRTTANNKESGMNLTPKLTMESPTDDVNYIKPIDCLLTGNTRMLGKLIFAGHHLIFYGREFRNHPHIIKSTVWEYSGIAEVTFDKSGLFYRDNLTLKFHSQHQIILSFTNNSGSLILNELQKRCLIEKFNQIKSNRLESYQMKSHHNQTKAIHRDNNLIKSNQMNKFPPGKSATFSNPPGSKLRQPSLIRSTGFSRNPLESNKTKPIRSWVSPKFFNDPFKLHDIPKEFYLYQSHYVIVTSHPVHPIVYTENVTPSTIITTKSSNPPPKLNTAIIIMTPPSSPSPPSHSLSITIALVGILFNLLISLYQP